MTVCVPEAFGGEYKPAAVIVPDAVLPPSTPSTSQLTGPLPLLAANCCTSADVSSVESSSTWMCRDSGG